MEVQGAVMGFVPGAEGDIGRSIENFGDTVTKIWNCMDFQEMSRQCHIVIEM